MNNKLTQSVFKELVSSFTLFVFITALMLFIVTPVFAQGISSVESTLTTIGGMGQQEILPGFATRGHSDASYQQGASNITSAILFVVDLFKYLIATVAVMVLIIAGIKLITAGKNIEEVSQSQKENIKYALIGLVIIAVADTMVQQVFFGEQGEVLRSEADVQLAAERGSEYLRSVYSIFTYFAGSLAVMMIVYAGFRLVTSGGQEETNTKMKKVITWAILGLVLVGLAELVVKGIVFPDEGSRLSDIERAKELIITMTNFVSGFVATVAIAFMMYGGYLYVTATGNEEQTNKAKKVFTGAIIGILVALGSYALVNTFVKLEQPAATEISGPQTSTLPAIEAATE